MEKDKSIMLQKQVRNNSEDLQSEYLDMKNWEEQMRKADSEIRNAGGDQILPPIRKKKKAGNATQKVSNVANNDTSKRIKSSDYTSWDKFDADKACEAVEKEHEPEEEPLSKEELEKNHAEATKSKVKGNIFVQKQQWVKAIACYNDAIKVFPYDAVFFANRALCHLKIDNFCSAEADCTAALQLDECYVKAYHRRATARIELKQYKEAAEDIKRILKLEPSNKEAQSLLLRVSKSIDNAKPLTVNDTRQVAEDTVIMKTIVEKLCVTTPSSDKEKNIETKVLRDGSRDEKKIVETEKPIKVELNSRLPEWIPEVQEDVEIVDVITKPPHQRSKKPLRTVPIVAIEFGAKKQTVKDLSIKSSEIRAKSEDASARLAGTEVTASEDVPTVPKTAVQFLLTWRKNKSTAFRYKYFKQILAERIPTLFQDSMESDTFSEIVNVLRSEFASREEPVFDYLRYLSSVKRFRTLTMFMNNTDKENLRALFDYAKRVEDQPDDIVKDLRIKYEI